MKPAAVRGGPGERRRAYRRGRRAEFIAVCWLRLKGYRVLARGRRLAAGEIDIIARRGRTVAVVEVKARASLAAAAEALGSRQRTRILRAARHFLAGRPEFADHQVRFDVIWIVPGRLPRHVIDAWRDEDQATL